MPLLLAFPDAITIARGVASPKLQGQATTKTLTKIFIAVATFLEIISHIKNETAAIIITIGTK